MSQVYSYELATVMLVGFFAYFYKLLSCCAQHFSVRKNS